MSANSQDPDQPVADLNLDSSLSLLTSPIRTRPRNLDRGMCDAGSCLSLFAPYACRFSLNIFGLTNCDNCGQTIKRSTTFSRQYASLENDWLFQVNIVVVHGNSSNFRLNN